MNVTVIIQNNKYNQKRPPIHLLHNINQNCVMKKRDLFPINIFNASDIFFCRRRKFIIPENFDVHMICMNLYTIIQVVGIPMGTNCAPLVEDLFMFCYE